MAWISRSHTITGSTAGLQTNYPVGIKVYYGSGVDGTEIIGGATFGKVYLDSKCKTDFGDIRFTKSDKVTPLDYWIEEQVDGDYAIIWVEVDSIPASPGTVDIYIHYGDPGATTLSNGDDTFLIFNDCESVVGWSEQTVTGSPAWGAVIEDGVTTIFIEANAHNEKLRIQYDTIPMTGRENRRALTRIKHTSWNQDGYFNWYTPLIFDPTQYDALRYSTYFNYYTIYASVGGVSDTTTHNEAHPSGWYRYEKKTNAAGEVTGYRDNTDMGTATVDGDYSGGKVMYYVNEWNPGLTKHYIDWFAIGKYVDPEPTHTAWGPEVSEIAQDLFAKFVVKQGSVDLKAEFTLRQLTNDLYARFAIPLPGEANLFAKFETNLHHGTPADLYCKVHIRRIYDLSDSGGLGFFWDGVGRGHVDIEILTPTGSWTGKFPDWLNMTWVALKWEDLMEVDIDGSRPDKSRITGILWTYHSDGIRRVDWIVGLPKGGDRDVFAQFVVRHSTYADLKAEFYYNHLRSDLEAEFIVRHTPTPLDLPAEFTLRQLTNELFADFTLRQLTNDLKAEFIVRQETTQDLYAKFETYPAADLFATFTLRQGINDLFAKFEVMVDRIALIEEQILGSLTQEVDFTGLDLNTHKFYRLIIELKNEDALQIYAQIFFNDDEVIGNYSSRVQHGDESDSTYTQPNLCTLSPNTNMKLDLLITKDVDGRIGYAGWGKYSTNSLVRCAGHWTTIPANLTSIKLAGRIVSTGDRSDGFPAGSHFQLYGYKA